MHEVSLLENTLELALDYARQHYRDDLLIGIVGISNLHLRIEELTNGAC